MGEQGKPENSLRSIFFSNRKRKSKRFKRIGNGLFRYQNSGVIYGVFSVQGQTVWKNLNTTDREHAKLRLSEEVRKNQKVNLKASHKTTLNQLLDYYNTNLENFAPGISENRRCLIKTFRGSWQYWLGMKVSEIRPLNLRKWLAQHRQRLKSHIYPQAIELVMRLKSEGRIVNDHALFNARSPEVALQRACKRLKIPRFSPRALRRMFIIRALEKGIDPRVVAAWQGHRDATLILSDLIGWWNECRPLFHAP